MLVISIIIRGQIARNEFKYHEEWAEIDVFMYTKIELKVGNKAVMKEERTKN